MTRKIYVADDNEAFAALCAQVARKQGWYVTVCGDGAQLVSALIEETQPALLLIDLHMPELDGIELIEALTQIPGTYRLRFITGGPASSARAARMIAKSRGLDVGPALGKPLPVSDLRDMLAEEARVMEAQA